MHLSHRLTSLPPYHFAEFNQKVAALRAAGKDVISLSIGDPDLPTPNVVLDRLTEAARQQQNQRYPEYSGMPALRDAFAEYFRRRFGVQLDPAREVLPLIGSKEGLAHLPLAIIDPGDVALIPDPYYPVYPTAVALAGGTTQLVPLEPEHGWLPDLSRIPAGILSHATTLWLNYPNNPTGASATLEFFTEAVAFARAHDLLLIHDMAYADVYYDGARPPSLLQVPGASDIAVELHSFSKAFNMAGFRIGMLVGNATVVEGLNRLKSNIDTGIFRPIQLAAVVALQLPTSWIEQRNAIYQRRRDRAVDVCRRLGLATETPSAGLYLWPRIPAGQTSAEFAMRLLEVANIAVTPGTNFGPSGEGYIRLSLTVADDRLDEAMSRLETAVAQRA
jgi:LL-diaminopimelate aminotransferase